MKYWSSLLAIVLVALVGPAGAQISRGGLYRIEMAVTPAQVPADGESQARLRLDVRDQRGRPAPDGTLVVVRTDVGLVALGSTGRQNSLSAPLTGGYAIVYITSNTAGTATVTAQVLDSRNVAYVDFVPEGEPLRAPDRVVDVSGAWVGYAVELNLIEARDRARVRIGPLEFQVAGVVQVNTEQQVLKAQRVTIRRGEQVLEGEDLYYDLAAKKGVLRRFGEEKVERVFFDGLGLRPLTETWEVPNDAFRVDRRETAAWILAKSISYFLREKVVLRRGSLWTGQEKILGLPPYWIIGLPGYTGAANSQALGIGSGDGIAVDFPVFYRVTEGATGALKIQKGARSSQVVSRDGWSVALAEEYRNGQGTEGLFEVAGLPQTDWGFAWQDSRPALSQGFLSTNVSMPEHKSLYMTSSLFDFRGGGRLSVQGFYDAPVDYDRSYGLIADWLSDPRKFSGDNLTYRVGLTLGGRRRADDDNVVALSEMYTELSWGTRKLGHNTRLSPMLSNITSWDSTGYLGNNSRADLRLSQDLGSLANLGLSYGLDWRQADLRSETEERLLQTVGLDLRANSGSRWSSFLNTSYDITQGDVYGYASFDYYLGPNWRWGLRGTYYDYDASLYRDLEVSLGRTFGQRELSLIYSTDTGHVWLGLGGFGLR